MVKIFAGVIGIAVGGSFGYMTHWAIGLVIAVAVAWYFIKISVIEYEEEVSDEYFV